MGAEPEREVGETKRFHAVIHGYVQGVNFRYYTRQKAQQLGLVGYVRNRWDGTVEVVAEGEPGALQRLLSWLHRGPSLAHVSKVETEWVSPLGDFQRFEVRY
jgi:acylphosphatase